MIPDWLANQHNGQLWLDDRHLLYQTCLKVKPVIAVETGTWKGGGSTYFIAAALHEMKSGKLISVESDVQLHYEAKANYEVLWPDLKPFVDLRFGSSLLWLPEIVKQHPVLDLVFLDGAQDADEMLAEFEQVEPHVRLGGAVLAHDWFTGKADKIKSRLSGWDLTVIGNGTGSFEQGSVGLAVAIKQ